MKPRNQLKRCFRCKNNLKCWQLDKDVPITQSEKDIKISIDGYIENVKRIQKEYKLDNVAEFMGLANMMLVKVFNSEMDTDYLRETVYNSMFIVFAMCNTSNDDWGCPDTLNFEEM